MIRKFSSIGAVAATLLFSSQAHASACSLDRYMHNGSVMDVQVCDGGQLTISYAQPRPGMAQAGARAGSLLFDGTEAANGFISGQSRLFSARCGVVTYPVSGSRQGNAIVLNGTAPIRGQGCQIVRHRQDNLVFSLLGGGAPGPNPTPQCPPGFVFSNGQCLRGNAGPAPVPRPQPAAGDWHAIAISTTSQNEAQRKAGQLGNGWYVMNTAQCPNFRNGYWIATAGPTSKGNAQAFANMSRGAYIKTCN